MPRSDFIVTDKELSHYGVTTSNFIICQKIPFPVSHPRDALDGHLGDFGVRYRSFLSLIDEVPDVSLHHPS